MPARRLAAVIVAALLAGCGGSGASGPPAATPATVAPQPAPAGDALATLANAEIASGRVPGIVVAIDRGGTTMVRAFGSRALSPLLPADAQTDFQIGSLTKAFTAAAILLLAQDGALSLDDPLARFVPEYPPAASITLREMLTMTSGIPADVNAGFTTLYGPIDRAGVVRRLASVPLDFTPGTQYAYSNQGYWLLGLVIERASGAPYDAFVAQRILTPLALMRTGSIATFAPPDVASGYWHAQDPAHPFELRPSWSADYLYSFGDLESCAGDLARWDRALASGAFLSPASLMQMFTRANPRFSPYAMGWFVDPDGTRWHDGETSGFNVAQAILPDGTIVVVLGNTWDQYPNAWDPVAFLGRVRATP